MASISSLYGSFPLYRLETMDCILSMTNWRTQCLRSDTKQYAGNLREDQYDRNLSVFLLSRSLNLFKNF